MIKLIFKNIENELRSFKLLVPNKILFYKVLYFQKLFLNSKAFPLVFLNPPILKPPISNKGIRTHGLLNFMQKKKKKKNIRVQHFYIAKQKIKNEGTK